MALGWLSNTICTLSLLVAMNAQSLELVFIGRAPDSNQITLECRMQQNSSPVTSPLFWVERSDLPRQLVNSESPQNGQITFVITQELEGMYFCSNSNSNIDSNKLDLVGKESCSPTWMVICYLNFLFLFHSLSSAQLLWHSFIVCLWSRATSHHQLLYSAWKTETVLQC